MLLILDNLRSAANVGSILRTCDATGVECVMVCGITPYPGLPVDDRDPVVINRLNREIAKTALGAEKSVMVEYHSSSTAAITKCRAEKRTIYALEQTENSHDLLNFTPASLAALVVGNEVDGVSSEALAMCDEALELPQVGTKESLNVAVATGAALYLILKATTK